MKQLICCEIKNNKLLIDGVEKISLGVDQQTFFKELYKFLQIDHARFFKMDGLCKLAFLAVESLVIFHPEIKNFNDDEIAFICANRHSSLETDEKYWKGVASRESVASPSLFVYTLPNILAGEVAIRQKWYGENLFFISENFDKESLYMHARLMFQTNKAKACVVGWADFYNEKAEAFFELVTP